VATPQVVLRTTGLDRTLEHNVGDLTAVVQAGVPLARLQDELAAEGQMLALDPPLGADQRATIGGIIATGDSGPLRHRYGGPRDLVLGITVALSDGTIARAGGKVIKNVAGYDVAKLLTGSFGTLGVILSVSVRVHPRPVETATVVGTSADPGALNEAAIRLAGFPLELDALDVAWRSGRGGLLAQSAGTEARRRSHRVARLMREAGMERVDVVAQDAALWARQRAGQRAQEGVLLRIATRPSQLREVVRAAQDHGATLVGRAAFGLSFAEVEPEAAARFRGALPAESRSIVLDGPEELRHATDPWAGVEGPALDLMRRVKARFDPAGTCNPGVFVGGI
jgi:glycolate oxidase FAD binding subunit